VEPRIRVLDLFPFGPSERSRIDTASGRFAVEHRDANTQEAIDALVDPDVEILLASHAPRDSQRLPRLRWIASVTAGVEEILVNHPERWNITVTNGSGLHVVAMGEYVLASLLQITQRIPLRVADQQKRYWPEWRSAAWFASSGTRLRGTTLVVVGYGSVGREIARLATALGMRVIAVKARPSELVDPGFREPGTGDPDGNVPERILGTDALGDVLGLADFVVIAIPLTGRTQGLVDAAFLGNMRKTAWLINVGRGGHADEDALLRALRTGTIAGAALDVFADEPLPPASPFWDLPNVIITPHLAGVAGTEQFWSAAADLMAENLRRYAAGKPLINVIDLQRGY
jgi:phosphoglycerate dehydrogenase-like enzyme